MLGFRSCGCKGFGDVSLDGVGVDCVCLRDTTTMHGVMFEVWCWGFRSCGFKGFGGGSLDGVGVDCVCLRDTTGMQGVV